MSLIDAYLWERKPMDYMIVTMITTQYVHKIDYEFDGVYGMTKSLVIPTP